MVFAFIISLFGIAVAVRICEKLHALNLFDRRELTKIGTLYLAAVAITLFALPQSRLNLWIALFAPLAVASFSALALVYKRSREFESRAREALALTQLKMKSGKSFRQSFAEVIAETELTHAAKLSEIMSVVVFSQQNPDTLLAARQTSRFVRELTEELIRIDRHAHSASRRLSVLREKLRIEDEFRRRSGQVLGRIRAQSMVMTGLYLALFGYMGWRFGFQSNVQALIGSALLFAAGAAWIWLRGRRLRWKV